jgi:hypothetical protein
MISLFSRKRIYGAELITLPAFCVPGKESTRLIAKRDAQLKWMRDKGVRYLGSPMPLSEKPLATVRPIARNVRLVVTTPEPGTVHDLARNG